MATLVLTAVGSAIGGPIGGAIGSIIGQQVDRAIFAPKPREGARLKELQVQTSSYGSSIPAIFGVMRVAGTVIWATDLIERRVKNGGGKGRPSTVNYSYSVSLAVALSSRPIVRIGRIWADGNLLRGANGDLKVDTQFRFYSGYANQLVDPLMASAEASGQCPSHRGLAYAVFEDLQLSDYGNRIPSMTFEIFESDDPVPANAIFSSASGGTIVGYSQENIAGYALIGGDAREGLAPLLGALPIDLGTRDNQLEARDIWAFSAAASTIEAVSNEGSNQFDAPRYKIAPVDQFPMSLSLRYYEKARDFQAGVQRSERSNASRNSVEIEFPAVLDAGDAKRLTELLHLQMEHMRAGWAGQAVVSGDRYYVGDWLLDPSGAKWRIHEIEHHFGSMTVSARAAVETSPIPAGSASPGRNLSAPDILAGETRLAIVDLPVFDATDPGKTQIVIFATGTEGGWKRAALSLQTEVGLVEIGPTALPAIMGTAITLLPPHNTLLVDETSELEIQLFNNGMEIAELASSALSTDAPYFWLQGEFVRCGNIEALGGGRYRLSHFQRGCFGSDATVDDHLSGDAFILLERDTARLVVEREFVNGDLVTAEALGIGDIAAVSATASVTALSTTPLAPVNGSAKRGEDGSVVISWIRRSRIDAGWRDGVDQVLAEDGEQYRILLLVEGGSIAEWLTNSSPLSISAAEYAALPISLSAEPVFAVRQIGRHAQSEPRYINIS